MIKVACDSCGCLMAQSGANDWLNLPKIRFNLVKNGVSLFCVTGQFDTADNFYAEGPLIQPEFDADGVHFCRVCMLESFACAVLRLTDEARGCRIVQRDVTAEDAARSAEGRKAT